VKVVIAIIQRADGHLLITRRSIKTDHGGFWEFPGGKVEKEESPLAALYREVREEVGLTVQNADFFDEIHYDYGYKKVHLLFYYVTQFTGQAACREQQQGMCWVSSKELKNYRFPEANLPILNKLSKLEQVD